MIKTKYGKLMLLSKCALCGNKKSRFMKKTRNKRIINWFKNQNVFE